jgi:hypothetical protein
MVSHQQDPASDLDRNSKFPGRAPCSLIYDDPIVRLLVYANFRLTNANTCRCYDRTRLGKEFFKISMRRCQRL